MIFQNITNAIAERAEIVKTNAQAHSPEILIGVGIAGMVTSTVLACRATLKAKDVVEKRKADLKALQEVKNAPENADGALYSDEDEKKDIAIINVQTGLKVVGLYLPAVTVGVLGASCFIKSNNIHRKHEASLAAAYASVDQLFKKYRERVKEVYGEDADDKLRYGTRTVEIEKDVVNEKGEVEKKKEKVEVIGELDEADFSFFFDESSRYWEKDASYNNAFARGVESDANIELKRRARNNNGIGWVRLSEIMFDFGVARPKTFDERYKDIGWVLNLDDPELCNTEINLGFQERWSDRGGVRHKLPPDRVILIRPNVQGNIFELMR